MPTTMPTLGWQSKKVVLAVEEKGEQHLREENMSLKEEAEKAKQNSEKRRLLTQTVQIPREILQELTSNGGVEGIKNRKGWDKETPRAITCHTLDSGASIVGSKWMLLVNIPKRVRSYYTFVQGKA